MHCLSLLKSTFNIHYSIFGLFNFSLLTHLACPEVISGASQAAGFPLLSLTQITIFAGVSNKYKCNLKGYLPAKCDFAGTGELYCG